MNVSDVMDALGLDLVVLAADHVLVEETPLLMLELPQTDFCL